MFSVRSWFGEMSKVSQRPGLWEIKGNVKIVFKKSSTIYTMWSFLVYSRW